MSRAVRRASLAAALVAGVQVGAAAAAPDTKVSPELERKVERARTIILADPREGFKVGVKLESLSHQLPRNADHAFLLASALWIQSESLLRTNDLAKARSAIERGRSVALRSAPVSKLTGDMLLTSGGVYAARAEVAAALNDYQSAFRIFAKIGDRRSEALSLIFLATLYNDAKDFESALRYLDQAVESGSNDPKLISSIYNNQGQALQQLGRNREAADRFTKARRIAKQLNMTAFESVIVRNIVRAQLAAGNPDAAERTAREAMTIARKAGGDEQPAMLATLAELAFQRGRTADALSLIERSFAGVDLLRTSMPMREAHLTAYRVYRAVGNEPMALAHLEAMKRLDDESTKLATQTGTALMGARFDFANQELRIARLKAEELRRSVGFEQERARAQRRWFAGVGAAALVVMAMLGWALFVVRRSRDAVRAANAGLAVTNDALGQALAAKTEFLATTSHEIRTPLNGILGMTEVMLADADLTDGSRERVRLVHSAGKTMRALVDDILDVAKIETGKLTVERAPFNLAEVLQDAARLWDEPIRVKGLTFKMALRLPPEQVIGDAARVRQVLFNLLSNATKFTDAGNIMVRADHDGEQCRISVYDTGIGIPNDKLEHVFESFAQADTSTTRRFGGTGLGLSISRNLARAMGGELSVKSAAGQGSTFTLTIPLPRHVQPEVDTVASLEGALLIVERNPIVLAMLRALMAPHRPAILSAVTVDEAIAAIETYRPRDLLLDEGAVGDGLDRLAAAALSAGCAATLLRSPETHTAAPNGVRVVRKPVTGPALVSLMFSDELCGEEDSALVPRAA